MTKSSLVSSRRAPFEGKSFLLAILFLLSQFVDVPFVHAAKNNNYDLPRYEVIPMSPNTTYRQNVCDLHEAFYNGTVRLDKALKGLRLRPLFFALDNSLSPVKDRSGKIEKGSLYPSIRFLDEVAKRGGFTWRNSYGISALPTIGTGRPELLSENGRVNNITSNISNNRQPVVQNPTIDQVLTWGVQSFDFVAMDMIQTSSRAAQGISSFQGYLDASIIMIGNKPDTKSNVGLLTFLEPFDWKVWLMTLFTMVIAAFTYQFMEWVNNGDSDHQDLSNDPVENIFFSFMAFTGDCRYEPRTIYSRIFVTSLAFWGLILSSAYTANLASFLVAQNTPIIPVETIGEAVAAKYSLCVIDSGAVATEIERSFPQAILIRVPPQNLDEIYNRVLSGECDLAVTTIQSWDSARIDGNIDPHCKLQWVGRTFKFAKAGFVGMSDSGELCSNLIRDVLSVHITNMIDEGIDKQIMEDYLTSIQSNTCSSVSSSSATSSENGDEENIQALSLFDLGGLFIVVYVVWFLVCLVAVASAYLKGMKSRRETKALRASQPEDLRLEPAMEASPEIPNCKLGASGCGYGGDGDVLTSERDQLAQKLETMRAQMEEMHTLLQKGKL